MKKLICELKPGTPFKYKERLFIKDEFANIINLINGEFVNSHGDFFRDGYYTLVTVCKRIRKSDIVERK